MNRAFLQNSVLNFRISRIALNALKEGHWVFGAVERGSNKCLLTEVEDRRAATLERIVQRWILPGTRIISDAWRGYQNLNNIAGGIYTHEVVVHQRNFVDPDDPGVHTQTIEGLWQHAKKKVRRQHGTSQQLFPSYLHEFLWRQSVAKNYFSNIIIAIHDLYPLWLFSVVNKRLNDVTMHLRQSAKFGNLGRYSAGRPDNVGWGYLNVDGEIVPWSQFQICVMIFWFHLSWTMFLRWIWNGTKFL